MVGGLGTHALGPGGIIALAFTYAWSKDMIIIMMTSAANDLKVIEETVRQHRRIVFWSIVIAIVVTFFGAVGMTLDVAY